uniref:OSJNBa0027H09.19 protein n=1 Tax=Oryza sativa subsp. japonica TaxID=39947 RepID=Q7XP20_ORYSJ|nr:OSJNBb0080H08.1 [Oryza sativa Japonica Group]CAE03819.2 OSJNBa0027H09.19 [Oryza sativa Japonica Group]
MAENSRRSPMESADAIVFLVGGALAGDLAGANTSAGGGFPTRCAMRGRRRSSTIVHARIDSAWAQGDPSGGAQFTVILAASRMWYEVGGKAWSIRVEDSEGGSSPSRRSAATGSILRSHLHKAAMTKWTGVTSTRPREEEKVEVKLCPWRPRQGGCSTGQCRGRRQP